MKTFWRCKICGDIHYGQNAPSPCPTCGTENAYHKISKEEAKEAMEL